MFPPQAIMNPQSFIVGSLKECLYGHPHLSHITVILSLTALGDPQEHLSVVGFFFSFVVVVVLLFLMYLFISYNTPTCEW